MAKLTIWPMPGEGGAAEAYDVDVALFRVADEDNEPNHLHAFGAAGDADGHIQLWLNDGRQTFKVHMTIDHAAQMVEQIMKAGSEAADYQRAHGDDDEC